MTNPTTNFGWVMPSPTDLVTDLPADFEVFGQAVDTSMADLKGGTTGQILSKATNTDMDFTWITNDVGDITAVNVTAPITGGGTSGAVTIGVSAASTIAAGVVQLSDSTSTTSSVLASTPTATKSAYDLANTANTAAGTAQTTANAAIPKSTVTTAGDVIYATGSAAVTRLGIGTAGQVLQVNSGATAPEWATPAAGGMTLLSTTTLSSTSTTISIAGGYRDIQLRIKDGQMTSGSQWGIRLNSDTGTKYGQVGAQRQNTTVYTQGSTDSSWRSNGTAAANTNFQLVIEINDYLNTTTRVGTINSFYLPSAGDDNQFDFISFIDTTAITSITVIASAGNLSGTAYLIGVN